MGSSNSVCINIQLDRTNPFFFADEVVSGTVNVSIKDRTVKVDEVSILLNGETGYITTRTAYGLLSAASIEYHIVTFLKMKKLLAIPQLKQKELIYHPGDYSWRFKILLPNHLPPTLNQPHLYPHVRYYLTLVIDKSWYKRNKCETLYLTIFPRLNLMYNSQWLTPTVFGNQNRKDVTLKGHLDKRGYLHGETITGSLEIDNPRQVLIKKVDAILTQHNRIESDTRYQTIFEIYLPTIDRRNKQRIIEHFAMALPLRPLAPSYDFHGGYDHTAHVNVNYNLEFDVKVEGMFTDFKVSVPITIGTECGTNHANQYEHNQTTNILPNSISYYPETNSDDMTNPPPSYSSLYE